jgi:hypothetical protein
VARAGWSNDSTEGDAAAATTTPPGSQVPSNVTHTNMPLPLADVAIVTEAPCMAAPS